jgi:ribosomal protein S27AE
MRVLKFDGRQTTLSQAISWRSLTQDRGRSRFMVYEHYDFARNPIVENQVFFLESKCIRCGSSVLADSLEELLQEEKRHRALCRLLRARQ